MSNLIWPNETTEKTWNKTKCDFQHFTIAVRKNISSFSDIMSIILQLDYEKAYFWQLQESEAFGQLWV